MSSSAVASKKKPAHKIDPKKQPVVKPAHAAADASKPAGPDAAKQQKSAAHTAGSAARLLDKAVGKGYADQRAALKPGQKHAAHQLGVQKGPDDKKKLGLSEAVQHAAASEHGEAGQAGHPLIKAKELLKKAEKVAEKKAKKAEDPKAAQPDDAPEVLARTDEKQAEKDGATRKDVQKAKKVLRKQDKHAEEEQEAAGVVAVAKDKAAGVKDERAKDKIKARKGAADNKEGQDEQAHGTPEEALAAEVLKAVQDKKDEKKGKKPLNKRELHDLQRDKDKDDKVPGQAGPGLA